MFFLCLRQIPESNTYIRFFDTMKEESYKEEMTFKRNTNIKILIRSLCMHLWLKTMKDTRKGATVLFHVHLCQFGHAQLAIGLKDRSPSFSIIRGEDTQSRDHFQMVCGNENKSICRIYKYLATRSQTITWAASKLMKPQYSSLLSGQQHPQAPEVNRTRFQLWGRTELTNQSQVQESFHYSPRHSLASQTWRDNPRCVNC